MGLSIQFLPSKKTTPEVQPRLSWLGSVMQSASSYGREIFQRIKDSPSRTMWYFKIMKARCYWSEMVAHPAQNVHDTLRYDIVSSPTISTGVECVSATVQQIVWLPISSPSLYKRPVSGNFAILL